MNDVYPRILSASLVIAACGPDGSSTNGDGAALGDGEPRSRPASVAIQTGVASWSGWTSIGDPPLMRLRRIIQNKPARSFKTVAVSADRILSDRES